jgi:D-alanyl-D-alanine dipeptidase
MHNLGLAVDCTLVEDGTDVIMPTAMHELSTAAAKTSANMTKYPNAKTLQTIFYNSGGRGLDSEWWHYQLGNTSTDLAVSITTACNGGCNFGLS